MRRRITISLLCALASFGLSACNSGSEPPSRDQFPIVNARVFELQSAVVDHDRGRIDSLLAAEILKIDQNSDSLLNYVYGPNRNRPFRRFNVRGIIQTDEIARVDCEMIDTAGLEMKPSISLTFKLFDDSLWLLKRFGPIPDEATSLPDSLTDSL